MDLLRTTKHAVVHIPAYRWCLKFNKNVEEETEHEHKAEYKQTEEEETEHNKKKMEMASWSSIILFRSA